MIIRKKLKHAETDYDLDGLQRHLRIEEDSRKRELDDNPQTESQSKANNVEINDKLKPKNETQFKKEGTNSNNKKKGDCYYCYKTRPLCPRLSSSEETTKSECGRRKACGCRTRGELR